MTTKINLKDVNLGYACICVALREKNIFMSRTCHLQTLKDKGLKYVKELAMANLNDIIPILEWNIKNDIYFFRLSSNIFPFGAHSVHGYSIAFADKILKQIGKFAKDNTIRITMHPGQYSALSSPNEEVIKNAIIDLKLHAEILDRMSMGSDSVIVIHGGGTYGNKTKALQRFAKNFNRLPKNVRNRLVLENDEMSYTIADILPLCEKLSIPPVIDFHHDELNLSRCKVESYFKRVFAIWKKRGIKPKVHISNYLPGLSLKDNIMLTRKHSDYIHRLQPGFIKLLESKYMKSPGVDVMIEAKMKEQALLRLRSKKF